MPGSDDEIRRLERIRDRQIADRDPSGSNRSRYRKAYQRQKGRLGPLTLGSMLDDLSHTLKGFIGGLLLGFVIWVVLSFTVTAWWVDWAGLGIGLLGAMLGIVIGSSFDWRDEIRKL